MQNAEAHQPLLDRVTKLETLVALDEAMDEIERGKGAPAREVMDRLRSKLGVRKGRALVESMRDRATRQVRTDSVMALTRGQPPTDE